MKAIETERLILRPWKRSDLDDLYDYAKNPSVGPNAGWPAHKNRSESKRVLGSFIKSGEVFAIELKSSGKVIGSLGLHADKKRENERTRMIGYVLGEPYWGQGLMPEAVKRALAFAFEDLGLDLVSVCHFSFNDRSKRVIEKCGFHWEGTLRLAGSFAGRSYDEVLYSMTRGEYLSAAGSFKETAAIP